MPRGGDNREVGMATEWEEGEGSPPVWLAPACLLGALSRVQILMTAGGAFSRLMGLGLPPSPLEI